MLIKTKPGHKYSFSGVEYMVVRPSNVLLNSRMIKNIDDAENRCLVVNLDNGLLTIHKYPTLTLKYFADIDSKPHYIMSKTYDDILSELETIYGCVGPGTVTCPQLKRSFYFDGDISLVYGDLSFIITSASLGDIENER